MQPLHGGDAILNSNAYYIFVWAFLVYRQFVNKITLLNVCNNFTMYVLNAVLGVYLACLVLFRLFADKNQSLNYCINFMMHVTNVVAVRFIYCIYWSFCSILHLTHAICSVCVFDINIYILCLPLVCAMFLFAHIFVLIIWFVLSCVIDYILVFISGITIYYCACLFHIFICCSYILLILSVPA